MTSDLVAFLRARLDEDEQVARAAARRGCPRCPTVAELLTTGPIGPMLLFIVLVPTLIGVEKWRERRRRRREDER